MKTPKEKVKEYIQLAHEIVKESPIQGYFTENIMEIAKMLQKEELENKPNSLGLYNQNGLGTNKATVPIPDASEPISEIIKGKGYYCPTCGEFVNYYELHSHSIYL